MKRDGIGSSAEWGHLACGHESGEAQVLLLALGEGLSFSRILMDENGSLMKERT